MKVLRSCVGFALSFLIMVPAVQGMSADQNIPSRMSKTAKAVIDGRTLQMSDGQRVRLIGVDTSETGSDNAAEFLKKFLPESKGTCVVFDEVKEDDKGDLLAYVYLDLFKAKVMNDLPYPYISGDYHSCGGPKGHSWVQLNALLFYHGYAAYRSEPPNLLHADQFESIYQQARSSKIGLWKEVDAGKTVDWAARVKEVSVGMDMAKVFNLLPKYRHDADVYSKIIEPEKTDDPNKFKDSEMGYRLDEEWWVVIRRDPYRKLIASPRLYKWDKEAAKIQKIYQRAISGSRADSALYREELEKYFSRTKPYFE